MSLQYGEPFPLSTIVYTMPEKRLKVAQINWRVTPVLKAAAEKAAQADNRTLTSLIEKLLIDYCRKKGFLKSE